MLAVTFCILTHGPFKSHWAAEPRMAMIEMTSAAKLTTNDVKASLA